jgi:uncharacterized membrane protein YgcG
MSKLISIIKVLNNNSLTLFYIYKLSIIFLFILFFGSFYTVIADAKSFVYEEVNVDISINNDSTVEVTETFVYRFNGEFRGVFRDLTLSNSINKELCDTNDQLQCGGFSYYEVLGVYDNEGNLLPETDYLVQQVSEYYGNKLSIRWQFSENGRFFDNETFQFTIKYKIYGSIGIFEDYDLLYWNTIPEQRVETIEKLNVFIELPTNISFDVNDLRVPGHIGYNVEYDDQSDVVLITKENILAYESFTVLAKLPKELIVSPATINLQNVVGPDNIDVKVNGVELKNVSGEIYGVPAGQVNLEISAQNYQTLTLDLQLVEGETYYVDEILQYSNTYKLWLVSLACTNIFGILLSPIFIFSIYLLWRKKGKDPQTRETIVPIFAAPQDMRPYLLGSLKDEITHIVDITASIIDLAYRGYIKIRHFKGKKIIGIQFNKDKYEFLKLKEDDDLSKVEKELMKALFGSSERVTSDMLENSFYYKLDNIKHNIYSELVEKNFFAQKPDDVRWKYYTIAGITIVIGSALIVLGVAIIFTLGLGISILIAGLVIAAISRYMPVKTELGAKALVEIKGFKMYLETAEKYTLQNLTPELFEKYLSYAIVFGIEKQWASSFKGLYKNKPDWFESDSAIFDAMNFANMVRTFNTVSQSTMTSTPPSSSTSSSGWTGSSGGWSGGGGFSGGFSGGGGGGGASGAW